MHLCRQIAHDFALVVLTFLIQKLLPYITNMSPSKEGQNLQAQGKNVGSPTSDRWVS
jgi:hypothetical protein